MFIKLELLHPITSKIKTLVTLIDTGSALSVGSETFGKNFDLQTCDSFQVTGVTGSNEITQFVTIKIKLGTRTLDHRVFIVPSLKRELILGNDLLCKEDCYINFLKRKVRIGCAEYQMYLSDKEASLTLKEPLDSNWLNSFNIEIPSKQSAITVRVLDTVQLNQPGYTNVPVTFSLQACCNPSEAYLFEWDENFLEKHAVLGPGLLVNPEVLDTIILTSLGPQVTLNKNTRIGFLTPIFESYHIVDQKASTPTKLDKIKPRKMTSEQLDSLKLAPDLNLTQQTQLKELLSQYPDCFCWDLENLSDLGKYNGPFDDEQTDGVRLLVQDHSPIFQKSYKMSMKEREFLSSYLSKLEKAGIISSGPCASGSPTLLVKKPGGGLRLVIDLRKVNATALHKCHQILPEVEDIFSMLSDFQYISVTDMASGYWQFGVDSRDRHITGMVTPDGTFQWNRLPQGLATSPFIFQSLIRKIFHSMLFKFLFAYLDDIIIFSNSFKTHLVHLKLFLDKLRECNLNLSYKKCIFATGTAKILGYILNRNGQVNPDPKKVQAISEMPPPLDKQGRVDLTKVRSFVGCVGFYRRFVDQFASRAKVLTNLTKKGCKPVWTKECQTAFEDLRNVLIQPPVLVGFRHSRPCVLHTDASDYGIGAVLNQKTEDNELVAVCFISRLLGKHEINYSVAEKECLAVVWALDRLRPYLYAKHFTVVSDNHAVCSLLKMKCSKNRRLNRWLYALSAHNLEIIYNSGKSHFPADCLSRLISFPSKSEEVLDQEPKQSLVEINFIEPADYRKEMLIAQQDDPFLIKIYNSLKAKETIYPMYVIFNELIYYRNEKGHSWRLAIPKSMRSRILFGFHDHAFSGHLGRNKSLSRLVKLFHWPKMLIDIKNYIASCIVCKQVKSRNTLQPGIMKSHEIPNEVFQKVFFDVLGPLVPSRPHRHQFCLVAVDALSKFVVASSARSYTALNVAKFIINLCFTHGCPEVIIWDNHQSHKSRLLKALCTHLHIVPRFTTSYSSTGNAVVERCIRSIENILACYVSTTNEDWSLYLPSTIFSLNSAINESTGLSPYFLLMGRHPRIPGELGLSIPSLSPHYLQDLAQVREKVKFNLLMAQEKSRISFDRNHKFVNFSPGDFVMLFYPNLSKGQSRKLSAKYAGPFRVIAKVTDQNYKIASLEPPYQIQIVHLKRLRSIEPRYISLADYDPATQTNSPIVPDLIDNISTNLNDQESDDSDDNSNHSSNTTNSIPQITKSSGIRTRSGRLVKPVKRLINQ